MLVFVGWGDGGLRIHGLVDLEGFCEVDDLDKTFRQKFRTGILSAPLCGYRANER